jgi:hypothetical protein
MADEKLADLDVRMARAWGELAMAERLITWLAAQSQDIVARIEKLERRAYERTEAAGSAAGQPEREEARRL